MSSMGMEQSTSPAVRLRAPELFSMRLPSITPLLISPFRKMAPFWFSWMLLLTSAKPVFSPHNAKALEGNIADVKVSQIETAGILDIHTVIAPAVDDKAGHGGIFCLVQNNGFVQRFIAGGSALRRCRAGSYQWVPPGEASITRAGEMTSTVLPGLAARKSFSSARLEPVKFTAWAVSAVARGASRVMTELYRFFQLASGVSKVAGSIPRV